MLRQTSKSASWVSRFTISEKAASSLFTVSSFSLQRIMTSSAVQSFHISILSFMMYVGSAIMHKLLSCSFVLGLINWYLKHIQKSTILNELAFFCAVKSILWCSNGIPKKYYNLHSISAMPMGNWWAIRDCILLSLVSVSALKWFWIHFAAMMLRSRTS